MSRCVTDADQVKQAPERICEEDPLQVDDKDRSSVDDEFPEFQESFHLFHQKEATVPEDHWKVIVKLWPDAEENLSRGKPVVKRAPTTTKEPKATKDPKVEAASKATAKSTTKVKPKKKKAEESEEEDEDDDADEEEEREGDDEKENNNEGGQQR
ncbi:hypothetical protein K438DRAFT_2013819 [Mycena galopus ATCC 62051]|nr:hypothetical protein K438DRAFT_2013819 [Mycena galopus ATCC 62051]